MFFFYVELGGVNCFSITLSSLPGIKIGWRQIEDKAQHSQKHSKSCEGSSWGRGWHWDHGVTQGKLWGAGRAVTNHGGEGKSPPTPTSRESLVPEISYTADEGQQ